MRMYSQRSDRSSRFFLFQILSQTLRKVQLLVCTGALLLFQPVYAEDLLEIYKLAVENDPRLIGAEHKNLASAQASEQSLGAFLPAISFDYQDVDTKQHIISSTNTSYGSVGKTGFPTRSYTLKLTQPLFNYASYVKHNQAKAEVRKAGAEFNAEQQNVIFRVAELYMNALAAGDELVFSKAEKAAVKSQLELAKARLKIGLARKADMLDAKSRFSNVEAAKIETKDKLDDSLQAIREVTGVTPAGSLAKVKKNIELVSPDPSDVEAWIKASIEQSPVFLLQRYAVEMAREEVSRHRAGHYPTLDLVAKHNNRDTGGSLFGGGSEVETRDVTFELKVPLYQGGIISSRTKQAAELYQKAKQDRERQRRALTRETRAAYFGVISSISRVKALNETVDTQRSVMDIKQEGFKAGLYTSISVLDAERDFFRAKGDYAEARYDYLLNTLRLKRAAGILHESDIVQLNGLLE